MGTNSQLAKRRPSYELSLSATPRNIKFYELTSVALCPHPPRKAILSSTWATRVVASRVIRVHTVRGTVAAIVVSIALNPEGQANP